MSALPNQTNINLREQFFVLVNASTITANSFIGDRGVFSTITFQNIDISGIDLSGGFITAEEATISSIYTRALYLDDNLLQTTGLRWLPFRKLSVVLQTGRCIHKSRT
jgi:hypothetical protein